MQTRGDDTGSDQAGRVARASPCGDDAAHRETGHPEEVDRQQRGDGLVPRAERHAQEWTGGGEPDDGDGQADRGGQADRRRRRPRAAVLDLWQQDHRHGRRGEHGGAAERRQHRELGRRDAVETGVGDEQILRLQHPEHEERQPGCGGSSDAEGWAPAGTRACRGEGHGGGGKRGVGGDDDAGKRTDQSVHRGQHSSDEQTTECLHQQAVGHRSMELETEQDATVEGEHDQRWQDEADSDEFQDRDMHEARERHAGGDQR